MERFYLATVHTNYTFKLICSLFWFGENICHALENQCKCV